MKEQVDLEIETTQPAISETKAITNEEDDTFLVNQNEETKEKRKVSYKKKALRLLAQRVHKKPQKKK